MKRWEVKFDGAAAGYVYADTAEAARRAARAGYKRVHPERDPKGRVRVGEGQDVDSEVAEARRLVSEVYEGLRLLPGMEMPGEKLRSALLLLESAAARDGLDSAVGVGASLGGGGDTELLEALDPVLQSKVVPSAVQGRLRGLLEWVGLNTDPRARLQVELKAFQALWEAGLVDLRFEERASCALYEASAYLAARLSAAGVLRVERFAAARDVDALRAELEPFGADAVARAWAFVPVGAGADPVEVQRPLVLVGERRLQRAHVRRGVRQADEEVVALDAALVDALERLRTWRDGLGRLADPHLKDDQRQLVARTEKRVEAVREKMAQAAQGGGEVLPPDTARRDLIKFVVDQVYRIEDALAFLPDRGLREAFGELVFKDVVFRGAGAYLSQRFGIHIDTEVVEGADADGLVGRFRSEPGGPPPRAKTTRIHSVVVPCYTQDGVAVRPAAIRTGLY